MLTNKPKIINSNSRSKQIIQKLEWNLNEESEWKLSWDSCMLENHFLLYLYC
jgi:hypothetical protein